MKFAGQQRKVSGERILMTPLLLLLQMKASKRYYFRGGGGKKVNSPHDVCFFLLNKITK